MDPFEEKVYEILIEARRLINQGWTQGQLEKAKFFGGTAYCALGAINRAARTRTEYRPHQSFLIERAQDKLIDEFEPFYPILSLEYFNDSPGTRKKDVLALFDAAISKLNPEKD